MDEIIERKIHLQIEQNKQDNKIIEMCRQRTIRNSLYRSIFIYEFADLIDRINGQMERSRKRIDLNEMHSTVDKHMEYIRIQICK